jgi:hypothetical protein
MFCPCTLCSYKRDVPVLLLTMYLAPPTTQADVQSLLPAGLHHPNHQVTQKTAGRAN